MHSRVLNVILKSFNFLIFVVKIKAINAKYLLLPSSHIKIQDVKLHSWSIQQICKDFSLNLIVLWLENVIKCFQNDEKVMPLQTHLCHLLHISMKGVSVKYWYLFQTHKQSDKNVKNYLRSWKKSSIFMLPRMDENLANSAKRKFHNNISCGEKHFLFSFTRVGSKINIFQGLLWCFSM